MIAMLERVAREVWAYHYRIPESVYWITGLSAAAALALTGLAGEALLLALFVLTVSAIGIVRWHVVRRRCRFGLVIPLFQEGAGAEGRSAEAQTLIVDHLRRHLPILLRDFVQPVPAMVTSADDVFAEQLEKRLRAAFVLHGRIATNPEGGWSVYPRVLEPAEQSVTHVDPFTRDRTPSNPHFGPFVTSLTPTIGVRDEEFPLEFCRDLEAVVNGLAGMAAAALEQHPEAERLLDAALAKAGDSSNHQIDSLRVARARAIAAQGRLDEAIDALRGRVRHPDPSPHLLRGLAHLLSERGFAQRDTRDADSEEAADHLRRALADVTDPQRDMTAYNLCNQIPRGTAEHDALVEHLLAPGSSYRRLWYVKQLEAVRQWTLVEEARERGDHAARRIHGKESAKWYGRTLRGRPILQLIGVRPRWPFVVLKRFERSPILYANAKDAHAAAEQGWRAWYFEWRFQRIRNRHLRRAERHLVRGKWNLAYAHFDWASSVGRRDFVEHVGRACAAGCCWKGGRERDGLAMWQEAAEHPDCILGRSFLVGQLRENGLDDSVPGEEPTDLEDAFEYIAERFPGWAWHVDGGFISPEELAEIEPEAAGRG
jgi:tetratricopeptide (TPR) repeat protein